MAEPTSFAATAKENVVIRSGSCTVTVLPQFGGKIASILHNGHELLQAPIAPVAARNKTMPFDAGDASGWDECLPSVAACKVPLGRSVANIPDHGDLWRVVWHENNGNGNGNSIELRASCFSLPLDVERTLTLAETGKGHRLSAAYKLTNTGSDPAPWSWAAHPLFTVAEGDRIVLPESIATLSIEGSGGNRLGKAGDTVSWPIAKLAGGEKADLRVARPAESKIGDKLFAGPLSPAENWCALERPSAGLRIRFSFNPAENPYLGLWLCYGGWPERAGPKQTCVALEPSTAPVDSLAKNGTWSRVLNPGKSVVWRMNVDLELL
jgi:galactose mutarotase-like enzyme